MEIVPDEPTLSPAYTKPPVTPSPVTPSPTPEPSDSGTTLPTAELVGPFTTTGLKTTLSGVTAIESERRWVSTTRSYWEEVYENGPLSDVKVEVSITSTRPNALRRRLHGGRGLQSDSLEVTYTQTTTYRLLNPELTVDDIVKMPLSTRPNRDAYVGELKRLDGYEDLTDVSEISITDDSNKGVDGGNDAGGGGGLATGAIIGIACGAASLLVLVAGFIYYRYQKSKDEEDEDRGTSTLASTQGPTASGAGTGSSLPTYGDTSVATVDYDYSRAYGGAGEQSLSEAGGTLGSRTRQTTGAEEDPAMLAVPGSGNTIFSDDPTFDQAYEDVREEIIDVYAPAGKLGVVIDTPDDGAPVVHAVKDTSPICDKVNVGDKLVAVDDEDVRAMTAIKVSKLISRKSNNASRKLTIIRHVANK